MVLFLQIDIQLFEDHVKLNKAADVKRDIELHLSKTRESLEKETGLNARLEQDVKNNEARECELKKIKQYQMKRPWVVCAYAFGCRSYFF